MVSARADCILCLKNIHMAFPSRRFQFSRIFDSSQSFGSWFYLFFLHVKTQWKLILPEEEFSINL